jgi:phytanoyl-CoA hydroxylase
MDFAAAGLKSEDALACVGPAGSCSFHHVRLVHGSAQNRSERSRGLLLYEMAAADAFPLMGIPDYEDFKKRLLCGHDTIVARIVDCPVRMPLPPALNQGSIYENQTASTKRFFDMKPIAQ